jgi:hypothetical protein
MKAPCGLDGASAEEARGNIHIFSTKHVISSETATMNCSNSPKILANILSKTIKRGASIIASIQMIVKQEMHL